MATQQPFPSLAQNGITAESPLLQLPQELLVRVASYLTTPELGRFRQVCKDVESRLFESFAYEFFHKRQFMIEEPSLQALVDISKHPTLSKRLTEVIISTMQFSQGHDSGSKTSQRLMSGGYATHDVLVPSGQARDMLVEAFQNLPNLRRVGLRDYDANGRYRDGDKAQWRSYAHSFAEGEIMNIGPAESYWSLLLQAVGLSGACVPSIEVFLRHDRRLQDDAFDVLSDRMSITIAPVLSQLRTLMLSLGSRHFPSLGRHLPGLRDIRLKRFLHHVPTLEHLRLNFDESHSNVLDWLALSPQSSTAATPTAISSFDQFAQPVAFPKLSNLDLGMVRVRGPTVSKILTRFSLKSFNLWRVVLNVDDRATITRDDGPNDATRLMDSLSNADALGQVEHAMIGHLKVNGKQDHRHREFDFNFPPAMNDVPKKSEDGKASRAEHTIVNFSQGGRAPNFATWAKEMAGRATVVKLHRGMIVSQASDGDEDLDESEMDEEDGEDDIEDEDDDEDEDEDEG